MAYSQNEIDTIAVEASKMVAQEFEEFGTPNPPDITPGMVRNVLKAAQESNINSAYDRLYEAARNILELAEPNDSGEYVMHQDNYNDLAEAHAAVFRAG